MKRLQEDAGQITEALSSACHDVHSACEIFVSSERPRFRRILSIQHVNEQLNQEIQVYYTVVYSK